MSGKLASELSVPEDRRFSFGPFQFDARSGQLWRDGREVKLTPRAAAVLHMLADRAQDLVTKQELLDRVWGGMAVSDDAVTSCIQEIRGALGDDARHPSYVETRHRRGYRLMVPVQPGRYGSPTIVQAPEDSQFVGRSMEIGELARAFEKAKSGRRQVVFVTGEPGIGKSSLVDVFVEQLAAAHAGRIAHGQCLDQHGIGEPYLPLIEALMRLAGNSRDTAVKAQLAAEAPSWLAQMPSLWTGSERRVLQVRGRSTGSRMIRELTMALEAIASDQPLLLKLEDIHWSDASTLDWIAHMARRPEPARLMLLATFRPSDAAAARIDLDRVVTELVLHGRCHEIRLEPLGLHAIEAYLQLQLRDHDGSAQLQTAHLHQMAQLLHERTGGNPLFMTSIVNQLARNGPEPSSGAILSVPHDVRRFIDRQIDDLNEPDRNLLTAASVIGRQFATAAVGAALEADTETVEAAAARLARSGVFIGHAGSTVWPDGTHAELYTFRHDLYRELLYERLPARRRALGHARVAARLQAAWAGRLDGVAAELAEHYDRGNEPARAIPHHQRAAAKALRRSANLEAIRHLERALAATGHVADADERTKVEVELRVGLGAAFAAIRGFGAPEVLEAYSQAETLCQNLGERADIFPALWGQWLFRWGRSEVDDALPLSKRLLVLADKSGDEGLKLQAHHAAWATSFGRGELAAACAHAEAGSALYNAERDQAMASSYGNHDACNCARNFTAFSLALAGEADRARELVDHSVTLARDLEDPFSLALSLYFAAAVAQVSSDVARARTHAEASKELATEYDLAMPRAWSTAVLGWCMAETGDTEGGVKLLTDAVTAMNVSHSRQFSTYALGLLAHAHMKVGQHVQAMQAVADGIALAQSGGERFYLAELHRLKGELLARAEHGVAEGVASFRTAMRIAGEQGAKALLQRADESQRRWSANAGDVSCTE